jgi:hypothetical protein
MVSTQATVSKGRKVRRDAKTNEGKEISRYSVALPSPLARQVETYAGASDISMSKAIVGLVRLGLKSHEARKREFFTKLRKNLANDDPKVEDQMVDEFRALILGH